MHRLFYMVCFLSLFSCVARAQDAVATTDQLIADIFEQYTAENDDDIDYDTFYEELMYFAENKINLNKTTREELERLPFLTSQKWY